MGTVAQLTRPDGRDRGSRAAKTYPGGVEAVRGRGLRGRAGRGVRPARPERRRQVDHDRHAHDHDRADRRHRPSSSGSTSPPTRSAPAASSAVVFQDAVVDRSLTGRRNLEIHARLWGVDARRGDGAIDDVVDAVRPRRRSSTGRSRPTAAANGAGSRSPARCVSKPTRAVPRRTDRRARPAHPLRAARRHRRAPGARRHDDPADDALPRRGRAALRPHRDRARGPDRRARHAGRAARRARQRDRRAARRGRRRAGARARCAPQGVAGDDAFAVGVDAHRAAARHRAAPTRSRPIARPRRSRRRRSAPGRRRSTTCTSTHRRPPRRLTGPRTRSRPMTTVTATAPPTTSPVAPTAAPPEASRRACVRSRRSPAGASRSARTRHARSSCPLLHADPVRDRSSRPRSPRPRARCSGIDYMSFVAIGTIGLLHPAQLHVRRHRRHRRPRERRPARPARRARARALMVFGNLAVALRREPAAGRRADRAALLRGADFHVPGHGRRLVRGRRGSRSRSAMYGIAETLASRIPKQEEYIGAVPADRDRAVVLRRVAVPDHVAARLAGLDRQGACR